MRHLITLLLTILIIQSCAPKKSIIQTQQIDLLDTVVINSNQPTPGYKPTTPIIWDLIHTTLDLKFDYINQEVFGLATLTLNPHFYKQNTVSLDAKWMEIKSVKSSELLPLNFIYKENKINIELPKYYSKRDTLELIIDYTAKPNSNVDKGGRAITSAKGIYFINPTNETPNKPQQIWTQGETDFSSCWFPTLDEPNQKTTQEIKLTVKEEYQTLSNGILEFSTLNGDGTRTDYWLQDKAHSPYLFMLAIGDFTITKDSWRDLEVNYYLEKEYEKDAQLIFGNTPEMMEYYSQLLGVDYPWDKYSQVVVRDFVSGAMENTSATLHGEFVQNHKRELLDYNPDDIIAHELFHQWFGDLVSCESWSNLPLNEAFATYGEILWYEYKYGADAAAHKLNDDLRAYLRESNYKQEDWVRFHYESKDDMFDSHSYSKGARILHMLRFIVGDEAFFSSLKLYLNRYKHKSAEMHQLRLCFEEITGNDLNWFFDQWAYASGHPSLDISHNYDSTNNIYTLKVLQTQDPVNTPIYRLPVMLEVHTSNGIDTVNVVIEEKEFVFELEGKKPLWVNFDAPKYLLCTKNEALTENELAFKYQKANNVIDKLEVLNAYSTLESLNSESNEILWSALSDSFYGVRAKALSLSYKINVEQLKKLETKLTDMALNDINSKVRGTALTQLFKVAEHAVKIKIAKTQLNDSSYSVISNALYELLDVDSSIAYQECKRFETETNAKMQSAINYIYSITGTEKDNSWMLASNEFHTGYYKIAYLRNYDRYLHRIKSDAIINSGIKLFNSTYSTSDLKPVQLEAIKGLNNINDYLNQQITTETDLAKKEKLLFQQEFLNGVYNEIRKGNPSSKVQGLLPNN
ncbi:MAG: M1 family metallopeptidase [Salibacteraceae bacterium]